MILSFVLVIRNRSSLGRAAAMGVTWQSLGFCLSSLVTHTDFLRKSILLLRPLCGCDQTLKNLFCSWC